MYTRGMGRYRQISGETGGSSKGKPGTISDFAGRHGQGARDPNSGFAVDTLIQKSF